MSSIFDYDTCAPPCWLGLIPGESIPADVERVLQMQGNLIDPQSVDIGPAFLETGYDIDPNTGFMRSGGYRFDIAGQIIEPGPLRFRNRIDISEGLVELIVILDHKPITLSQALAKLGTPDMVRLLAGAANTTRLRLVYEESRLWVNLVQTSDTCFISTLAGKMLVDSMLYYSPKRSAMPIDTDYGFPQPTLTGYNLLDDRDVPLDLWESWLSGEVDMSCAEAWALLPPPEITPTVEATSEVRL